MATTTLSDGELMATVRQVNPAYLQTVWPVVKPMLEKALDYSAGEYNVDQMKVFIAQGNWALLIAEQDEAIIGACVVCFENYPNDRIAFVTAIGGRFVIRKDLFDQLAQWAKSMGCTKVRGAVRESVSKLWQQKCEAREIYRIVEKTI